METALRKKTNRRYTFPTTGIHN